MGSFTIYLAALSSTTTAPRPAAARRPSEPRAAGPARLTRPALAVLDGTAAARAAGPRPLLRLPRRRREEGKKGTAASVLRAASGKEERRLMNWYDRSTI